MKTSAVKPLWSQQRITLTGIVTTHRPPPPPMQPLNRVPLSRSPATNLQLQQAGGQSPARRPNKGKEKMKDTLKFPGFVNSFLPNTPSHPSQQPLAPLVTRPSPLPTPH